LGRERGQIVDRTEHEAALDAVCRQFANLLSRLPEELATEVAGRSLNEVRKTLRDWSERVCDQAFGKPET
jgi:hypothetical protein